MPSGPSPPQSKRKPLTTEALHEYNEKLDNRGVCYIARVPPYLKPNAIRNMLDGYGTQVLRIFLQPEDSAVRQRRVKSGGNKKNCFSEGWVEFLSLPGSQGGIYGKRID